MPSLEKHIALSKKRTGKEFREMHEWMDGKSVSTVDELKRHSLSAMQQNLSFVGKNFGKDAALEFFQHLNDDYKSLRFWVFMKLAEKQYFLKILKMFKL